MTSALFSLLSAAGGWSFFLGERGGGGGEAAHKKPSPLLPHPPPPPHPSSLSIRHSEGKNCLKIRSLKSSHRWNSIVGYYASCVNFCFLKVDPNYFEPKPSRQIQTPELSGGLQISDRDSPFEGRLLGGGVTAEFSQRIRENFSNNTVTKWKSIVFELRSGWEGEGVWWDGWRIKV